MSESLRYYKDVGYGVINSTMRSIVSLDEIQDNTIKSHIQNIESSMKKGSGDLTLYRGVPNLLSYIQNESNILIERGFCSTSPDIMVSTNFTSEKCCILCFKLPKDLLRYEYRSAREPEILVQRNIQFIVDTSTYHVINGYRVFHALVKVYEPPRLSPEERKQQEVMMSDLDLQQLASSIIEDLTEFDSESVTKEEVIANVMLYKSKLSLKQSVLDKLQEYSLYFLEKKQK